jgi:hypothetical protein
MLKACHESVGNGLTFLAVTQVFSHVWTFWSSEHTTDMTHSRSLILSAILGNFRLTLHAVGPLIHHGDFVRRRYVLLQLH